MRRVRLVIADRRPIVLQGVVSLLGIQPDFEVVACCLDGASCLAAIRTLTPDVVLLEDGFTDVTASNILAVVNDERLSSRLVFFTATVACGDLASALGTGACGAISMNAKPDALVQSLRLERPGSDLARVGKDANGVASFGNNVQALLTVNEWTIMDLVAEGLSDSEIARVLGVSLEIVRIHIDHVRAKLRINSRTELAALALSRRYGAMSILAAAVLAALDDTPGHAAPESFTIKVANGCAEVVTIKIRRKEIVTGGNPARGANKDRAALAGKFVDPLVEINASPFAQAALNESRMGSSGYSISMIAAFAALIYQLDGASHAAQAFDFGDRQADIYAPSTASDINGSAAALPGFANLGGTAVYDEAFAFKFAQGDPIATEGSELHVGYAHTEDGDSDQGTTIPQGSGTVDAVATAANGTSARDPTQAGGDNESDQARSQSDLRASDNSSDGTKEQDAPGDDLNHGRSQKALRESDNGSGTAKEHVKHEAAVDDSNRGQAQKALHESGNSSGAANGHSKQEALGDGTNHGQSQKALHDADDGSTAANGHAKHEDTGKDVYHGQPHNDLQDFEDGSAAGKQHAQHPHAVDLDSGKPQEPVNSANDTDSASKIKIAGKGGPSSDDAGQAQSAVGSGLGDSFHFKKGLADNASLDIVDTHLGDASGNALGDGRHAAAHEAPVPAQDIDAIDLSAAQHDHSGHVNLHAVHDLIV